MSDPHARDKVTVALTREDFEVMLADALESIVREPYDHKIVVDEVGQNITDNTSDGWYIEYHLEEEVK